MKVSFIIPSYNSINFIKDCIFSIQQQTLHDIECIIVDDESTDGTYEACLAMAKDDSRIIPIQVKHCCAANSRNVGIELAKGEYVWLVDSDDLLDANAAEKAVHFADENNLEMAMIDGNAFQDSKNVFSLMHTIFYLRRKKCYGIGTGMEILRKMIEASNFNCYVFLQLVRRDAIRHKFPIIALDEDFVYTVQNLANMKRVGHLNEVLYHKRCREESTLTSSMTLDKTVSLLNAGEILIKWIDEMLAKNKISLQDAKCIETLLMSIMHEIKPRFKNLNAAELKKLSSLSIKERVLLKLIAQ